MTTMTNTQTNKALSDAELDTVVGGSLAGLRFDIASIRAGLGHPIDNAHSLAIFTKGAIKNILDIF
jgi:hypothetical protein